MSRQVMDLLKQCAPVFSILADENRQEILLLLDENKQMTVTELAQKLPLSRPAISHHLKHLLDNKLVEVEKRGTERHYSLNLKWATQILKLLVIELEKIN
ncbi:ArsR/SmtB family transcription factor [Paenibacillus chibensis]|uniref:ArsR/SmtB family transcription factor n=1 Tax=Paenibacillus chibensis TaxID=59846 RepID=UPI000FD88F3F|nr:metalloregulator ArsR/SmtB family transcription factor [Paenibacillus chibensis]MEC0372422.1 metalloregulator ArsR/SmtB family transcription factor [Paenibacillus chibensis]